MPALAASRPAVLLALPALGVIEIEPRQAAGAWREASPAGIRHTDEICVCMELPSLKIMALPAFTVAGLAVKARLAEFN